jgi:hypothetical protein
MADKRHGKGMLLIHATGVVINAVFLNGDIKMGQ